MKIRQNLFNILGALSIAVVGLTSCNSDLDKTYVLNDEDITLAGASKSIILSADNPDALALTLYWSGDGHLTLNDTLVQAPVNAAETTIQFSSDEDFSSPLDITVDKGVYSRQFLCEEFNSLLGRLNYEADVLSPLWIRVRSELAANMEPRYSNVLKVAVQPYRIHLNLARVLDKNQGETSMQLASPDENGIYQGFMGVNGWENWWLRENNNVTWGNLGQTGKTFYISSDDSHWNFWFPNPSGCYYTTVNTVEGWWSALHIDNLTVSGDISGEMEYNKSTNQWTLPVSLSQAQNVKITISGNGSLYNTETTDVGDPIQKSVGFSGDAQNLSFGESASAVSVSLPSGSSTLILDLSNPLQFTVAAGEATVEPEVAQHLYFSGLVTWDGFTDFLTLYDESSQSYGGAQWIQSEWGYRAYTSQAWDPAYKAADGGTALEGSLVLATSDGNIPAPETGLYVMDFQMGALTYQLTKVESVSFVGLNDDWSEHAMTQSASNPEVFTGEFVKEKETPWGVKVLINGNWGLFFGGGDGILRLGHSDADSGFDGDNDLEIGKTYILTVDLGQQTYSYSLKQ